MFKFISKIIVSVFLLASTANANQSQIDLPKLQLDPEFIKSLTIEQKLYLEGQLKDVVVVEPLPDVTVEEDDYDFFDMDKIENEVKTASATSLTDPTRR